MHISLTSTTKVVEVNGVPARVWEGHSVGGVAVIAFVTRIAVERDSDLTEFERELESHEAPSSAVESFPARMVID